MSEIARALAAEGSFDWEGKTYRLAPMTYDVISLWEDYLAGRAWKEMERSARHLTAAEFDRQARGLREDLAAGNYGFFSRVSDQARQTWEGLIEIASIRVIVAHADLDPIFVRKMVRKIQEHHAEKWAELKRKMEEADHDPNPPAPETPGTDDGISIPSAPSSSTGA